MAARPLAPRPPRPEPPSSPQCRHECRNIIIIIIIIITIITIIVVNFPARGGVTLLMKTRPGGRATRWRSGPLSFGSIRPKVTNKAFRGPQGRAIARSTAFHAYKTLSICHSRVSFVLNARSVVLWASRGGGGAVRQRTRVIGVFTLGPISPQWLLVRTSFSLLASSCELDRAPPRSPRPKRLPNCQNRCRHGPD